MPDWRTILLVVLLVTSAGSVGALAGYRLYVAEVVLPTSEPVNVTVEVRLPDGANVSGVVGLVGLDRNAFAALARMGEDEGLLVEYKWYGRDVYVFAIGGIPAEGRCGWTYAVDGEGLQAQPDRAANHYVLNEGQHVLWDWTCA